MEALGLDLRTFLFQALNFVVLLAGLTYFLYKPLQKLLGDRQKQVADSLAAAERLRRENEAAEKEKDRELQAAREQAQAIIDEAREQAKQAGSRVQAEAKEEAARIVARAQKEAQEERARGERELREELVTTILTTTGKLLESDVVSDDRTAHTHHLVQELHGTLGR